MRTLPFHRQTFHFDLHPLQWAALPPFPYTMHMFSLCFFPANIKEKRFLLPTFDPRLQRSNMASLSTPRQHPTLCFRYAQSGLVPLVLKTYLSNEMTNICNLLLATNNALYFIKKVKVQKAFLLSTFISGWQPFQGTASSPSLLCSQVSLHCTFCTLCNMCNMCSVQWAAQRREWLGQGVT